MLTRIGCLGSKNIAIEPILGAFWLLFTWFFAIGHQPLTLSIPPSAFDR
jgi:hypothetical protein